MTELTETNRILHVLLCCILLKFLACTGYAAPLLPDLVSYASLEDEYMYGGIFDTVREPGRVLYRFDVAITNFGDGPFQVVYQNDLVNQTQDIYQEVLDSEGGFSSTLINIFELQQGTIGALSFTSLARYSLKEVLPNDGVGAVVATNDKTSHAVVDSVAIDKSLPGSPSTFFYRSGFINPLGISVGYADLYGRNILEQRLDVTGVPSGQYWLEVEIDPLGRVQELDDTNNITRILVDLEIPTLGDYDDDQDVDGSDFLLWQTGGSPNNDSTGDFASWISNYGTTYPPLASAAAVTVPEPNTAALIALSALLAVGSRGISR